MECLGSQGFHSSAPTAHRDVPGVPDQLERHDERIHQMGVAAPESRIILDDRLGDDRHTLWFPGRGAWAPCHSPLWSRGFGRGRSHWGRNRHYPPDHGEPESTISPARGALTGNVGWESDVRSLPRGVAQTGSMKHCATPDIFTLRELFHKHKLPAWTPFSDTSVPAADSRWGVPGAAASPAPPVLKGARGEGVSLSRFAQLPGVLAGTLDLFHPPTAAGPSIRLENPRSVWTRRTQP